MNIFEKMLKKKLELTSAERYARRKELNRLNAEVLLSAAGQRQKLTLPEANVLEQKIKKLQEELGPETPEESEYEKQLTEADARQTGNGGPKKFFGKGDFKKQS